MTPVMARELAHVAATDANHHDGAEADHRNWCAAEWQDIAVDCDRDSIGELLAAMAADLEAA